jgi:hypothetical protein
MTVSTLKSTKKIAVCIPNGPVDTAYKVIGSMNFPERKKRLEQIT